jgi:N-acyl-D-amino-acid deacylase
MKPLLLLVAFVLSSFASPAPAGNPQAVCDLLFVNGKIIDGSGNPWFYGDVAVKDDRIVAVGLLAGKTKAVRTIDIRGKVICPGFIDIHTHTYDPVSSEKTWTGGEDPRYGAPNYVTQGVTSVTTNMCGYGPVSLLGQIKALQSRGTGVNVMPFIGHNSVRRDVMKNDYKRAASEEEIRKMAALIKKAMEDGAFGLSSGLEYVPAIWSTNDEVKALVRELVPFGGVFMAHERSSGFTPMWYVPSQDPPGPPTMVENIRDLIDVSESTGARVVASHIKARGADFWGGSSILIRMINDARARGVDIWADCYPYNTSGSDGSVVLIPDWALGNNPAESLKAVLKDEKKRAALEKDIHAAFNWRGGPENVVVLDYPDKSYVGKSLAELAAGKNISPLEMTLRLQLEGFPRRPGGATLRGFSMNESDIEAFYRQPWVATSSDGSIALPKDGLVHPRFYGTFPRRLSHYALQRGVYSLEDAIRSATSLPALICRLADRGRIGTGLAADLVVFDPKKIRDAATVFEPHKTAEGIEYVLVNGTFVVEAGQPTAKRPGRVLTVR